MHHFDIFGKAKKAAEVWAMLISVSEWRWRGDNISGSFAGNKMPPNKMPTIIYVVIDLLKGKFQFLKEEYCVC